MPLTAIRFITLALIAIALPSSAGASNATVPGAESTGKGTKDASDAGAAPTSIIKHILAIPCLNPDGVEVKLWLNSEPPKGTKVRITVGKHTAEVPYGQRLFLPLPGAPRWTPDTPNLLKLYVRIGQETQAVRFGLRRVEVRGEKLYLNGQPFYARGFGCDGNGDGQLRRQVTTPAGFRNYVRRAKEFGFNTMRSHMPDNDRPQGFLDACDELGLFIWPEFWLEGDIGKLAPFWNHPSVIWWCWGNEIAGIGTAPWAKESYELAKKTDPSRVVQDNSGWGQYDRPTTDIVNQHMGYYFPHGPRTDCYSSYALFTAEGSMMGKSMADLMQEMRDGKFHLGKPLLAHETGNHQAFPDVLRRKDRLNLPSRPAIMEKMQTGDRLKYLDRWVEGSGKFKQAMDKVWIEQVRKSPIVEGFEMWMLADHSYAFCGVIEDGEECAIKPFVSPAYYRLHNAADVLLADFPEKNFKRCFASGEKFSLKLLASVYGPVTIPAGEAVWTLSAKGKVAASGKAKVGAGGRGRVSLLGDLAITMPKTSIPLELVLRIKRPHAKTALVNEWNVWVFPETEIPSHDNVLVVKDLTDATIDALANGARVLLILEDSKAVGRSDQAFASTLARFRPQMWVWGHNLGAYVPDHPAMKWFPHSGFSDMQFYRPIDYGRKIVLDDCPFAPDPIVDAIDIPTDSGLAYCRKATYLFELAVGRGKLLVTGFNFTEDNLKNLEVRALMKSLVDYAASPEFNPAQQVDKDTFTDYVRKAKANPIIGGEGYWNEIFYNDTELLGRNKFLDAGEEPPVVKATPYPGASR